jgi:hypothetical protein
MSRSLQNNADTLKFLCKTKHQYRKALLKSADKDIQVHCICECAHNTLLGKVPLTKTQKSKLSKHKSTLRKLAKRGTSLATRKKVIFQKDGAFLPLLLTPVISGVLSSLFNK